MGAGSSAFGPSGPTAGQTSGVWRIQPPSSALASFRAQRPALFPAGRRPGRELSTNRKSPLPIGESAVNTAGVFPPKKSLPRNKPISHSSRPSLRAILVLTSRAVPFPSGTARKERRPLDSRRYVTHPPRWAAEKGCGLADSSAEVRGLSRSTGGIDPAPGALPLDRFFFPVRAAFEGNGVPALRGQPSRAEGLKFSLGIPTKAGMAANPGSGANPRSGPDPAANPGSGANPGRVRIQRRTPARARTRGRVRVQRRTPARERTRVGSRSSGELRLGANPGSGPGSAANPSSGANPGSGPGPGPAANPGSAPGDLPQARVPAEP